MRMFSQSFLKLHLSTWKIVQKAEKSRTKIKNILSKSRTIIHTSWTPCLFKMPPVPERVFGSTIAAKRAVSIAKTTPIATCTTYNGPAVPQPVIKSIPFATRVDTLVPVLLFAAYTFCDAKQKTQTKPKHKIVLFFSAQRCFNLQKTRLLNFRKVFFVFKKSSSFGFI